MVRVRPHVRSAGSEREGCRGLSTRRDAPVLILRAPGAAMMAPLEPGLRPQGSAAQAAPMVRRATRSGREQVSEAQRARIVSAMVRVASDHGVQSASVTRVRSEAGVSGKTFYAIFEDRNDCLFAAIEQAWALAGERASAAYTTQQAWVDSVRAGLLALLELFDEEPGLARLCVVDTLAALPTALARRGELLKQLARVIDRGRDCSSREPPPLAAEGVVGGALGVIDAWLRQPDPRPLVDLLNPLMGFIVLPYLGGGAALTELQRPVSAIFEPGKRNSTPSPLAGLDMRLTYRTMRVLAAIAAEPGLSNSEIRIRVGVKDHGQISKLLARLARLGLIESPGDAQPARVANAWKLTRTGHALQRAVKHESLGTRRSEHTALTRHGETDS
jgi:AcrR family transcriptional regulator